MRIFQGYLQQKTNMIQFLVVVKSKTVILLNYGWVLIYWSSNHQYNIALSTWEVEYIELSQGIEKLVQS